MNAPNENEILQTNIAMLELSPQCKQAMNGNQIKNMKQLLKYRTDEVERWPGFNIQLVHEYVSLLESKGLGRLIDCY